MSSTTGYQTGCNPKWCIFTTHVPLAPLSQNCLIVPILAPSLKQGWSPWVQLWVRFYCHLSGDILEGNAFVCIPDFNWCHNISFSPLQLLWRDRRLKSASFKSKSPLCSEFCISPQTTSPTTDYLQGRKLNWIWGHQGLNCCDQTCTIIELDWLFELLNDNCGCLAETASEISELQPSSDQKDWTKLSTANCTRKCRFWRHVIGKISCYKR